MTNYKAIGEFRFGLKRSMYNYNMKMAREAKGLTMQELAKQANISLTFLYSIQSFRAFPSEALREKIAVLLEIPIDNLFPGEIKSLRIQKIDDITVSLSEAMSTKLLQSTSLLQAGDWEDEVDRCTDAHLVHEAISTLSPREQVIIRLRFGIDSGISMTLGEIGLEFGVQGERIRQIEAKALRKLRHPRRSKKLRDIL